MIITLIFIGIFVAGIVLLIIGNSSKISYNARDIIMFIVVVCLLIGGILGTITGGISIGTAINADLDYEKTIYERDVLEYRLEHSDENMVGNELLYNDIVEFNNRLRHTKEWADSPWISWFFNQKIADIEYIELDLGD